MFEKAIGALVLSLLASTAFAGVTAISDVQRGQSVIVQGVVDRFFDTDEIRLRDETGTLRVYLGPETIPLTSGERIVVEGVMDDDLIRNELYAREITRENGEQISISHRYE